jgi:succinate dehydrogenase / fumarate reductase cytochrome b subunit
MVVKKHGLAGFYPAIVHCDTHGRFLVYYKYNNILGFKEYRTNLATNETTCLTTNHEVADFERSISTENNVEIVSVKDCMHVLQSSFSQIMVCSILCNSNGRGSVPLAAWFPKCVPYVGMGAP